ncbi:MAG: heme-binding protein [Candidatus Vecturithrix sp.]|jgi:glc operon protein GlcG|nr:heme-binding protein [Candidatus Vecturithrix sp.]
MYQSYQLSHADALKIITAIQAELEKGQKGAAVAVVDTQGELMAFLRTDGCRLPSINIAINKAFTAARERKESAKIGQSSRDQGFPMSNFGDVRYTGWGGGVPIVYQGQVIGAVGVSSLPEQEDMKMARLGAGTINAE